MSTRDLQLGKVLLYPFFFFLFITTSWSVVAFTMNLRGENNKTLKFECRAQNVIGMLSFFLAIASVWIAHLFQFAL